jgi:hypothetical protein
LSDQFYSGARRQDGLNNNVAYLWKRSPAAASGNPLILSSANFDNLITKTPIVFSKIGDPYASLSSSDVVIHYSHIKESGPKFYNFAGKRVLWRDNPDFRALTAYAEATAGIAYFDRLLEDGYVVESPSALIAWREAVCSGQTRGTRSCNSAGAIIAAPVLPLYLSVDNAKTPDNIDPRASETHFCPFFNTEYYTGSSTACFDRGASWRQLWHEGSLRRQVSFYKDYVQTRSNLVDDGDVVLHELAHAVQTALNPEIMEVDKTQDASTYYQMDAVIEGMADFFVAAFRRDDTVFRYANTQIREIYPDDYVGSFGAKSRDPKNALSIPSAYSSRSIYDIGRILSGAMNDYRQALQGVTIAKLAGPSAITGLASPKGEEAWDMALGLLLQTFYKFPTTEAQATLTRFAGQMLATCDVTAQCESTLLKSILINRGLLSQRYFDHASIYSANKRVDEQTIKSGAAGTANEFLFTLGKSNVTDDDADKRWGLYMPQTLGWAPFTPGGSLEFNNGDAVLNPCEVVVVFPQIVNQTQSDAWGAARARSDAAFPAISDFITNFTSIPIAQRGLDVVDLNWKMAVAPFGFQNFQHPTLGYPDLYTGVNTNDVRGIPFLPPTKSVQDLVVDQGSDLYKIYQERAFDLPWSSKTPSSPADVAKLRSRAGWIFRLPSTPTNLAQLSTTAPAMTFSIEYSVSNLKDTSRRFKTLQYFTRAPSSSPVLVPAATSARQYLVVADVDAGFCD